MSDNPASSILDVTYIADGNGQSYSPKVITKFFSKSDAKYIASGSFRFGTLVEYRTGEHAKLGARMSDSDEGRQPFVLTGTGYVKSAKIGNFKIGQSYCSPGFRVSETETAFNSLVFCAMVGPYNQEYHKNFLNGCKFSNGTRYNGNADLTEWVELKFDAFVEGLVTIFRRDADGRNRSTFLAGPVQYTKQTIEIPLIDGLRLNPQLEMQVELLATYNKPSYYSPEREYRIVIRPDAPHTSADTLGPRIFHDDLLKKCILSSGSLRESA